MTEAQAIEPTTNLLLIPAKLVGQRACGGEG